MNFSFTVLLTLTFFSGILIILLWIMLHNNQIIQKAGISNNTSHVLVLFDKRFCKTPIHIFQYISCSGSIRLSTAFTNIDYSYFTVNSILISNFTRQWHFFVKIKKPLYLADCLCIIIFHLVNIKIYISLKHYIMIQECLASQALWAF